MVASESPPPNSFNSSSSPQIHPAAAATAYQASSDTNTDADSNTETPDALTNTTSINYLRNSSALTPRHHQQQLQGVHRPLRRVGSIESPRLSAQRSLAANAGEEETGGRRTRPPHSAPA
ncbi:hypothetical protein BGZ95_010812, partial [Linnemannia exigua]